MTMGLVLQTFAAWLLAVAGAVVVLEALHPLYRARVRAIALDGGVKRLVLISWLPVLLGTLVVAGCYTPWALARFGYLHDHCEAHGGHIHLCVEHVNATGASVSFWVLLVAAAAWMARGAYELVRGVRRGGAVGDDLGAIARCDEGRGVSVVDAAVPLSLTTGLWTPRIFVTQGLLDALSEEQRMVLIEHERCHVRERHALLKLIAAVAATVWRASTRELLLGELTLACERRSDEWAAARVGDRLEVASTLIAGRRALRSAALHGVLALQGDRGLEARVRMLTDAAGTNDQVAGKVARAALLSGGLGLLLGHGLHHAMETVLSHFLF
jgi:Zn-dependent protease with chaperone function